MSSKKKEKEIKEEKSWERIDNAVFESGHFLEKYSKQILIGVGALVLIVCAYMAYNHFYVKPKNENAQNAIFRGQYYFNNGQDSLALYGDGNEYIGFESIINEYGSTSVGNLAKGYAGLCYSRMGKYEEALSYLKDYKGKDAIFSHLVGGAIGDCLDNQGKPDEAVSYFEKAAKGVDSQVYSPALYKKAALIYRNQGNYDKVIELFTIVKNKYMNSPIAATEADKYIEEATLLKEKK